MTIPTIIFAIVVLMALGLSIYGVFNKRKSPVFIMVGLPIAILSSLGALHAWGEGQDINWTVFYIGLMIIGLISSIRNVMFFKKAH